LSQIVKQLGDPQFWAGLTEIKEQFLEREKIKVNDGQQIRFWEDRWK
jgi:hypothetical protein